jgi:hypothetical protein
MTQHNTIELDKDLFRDLVYEELEDFEVVEAGKWIDYGKYQHNDVIVKQCSTGKFFSYRISRSGSYHSDFYYNYEYEGVTLTEVEPITKTITVTKWEPVKQKETT